MKLPKRVLLIAVVSFSCVGCDQITKSIARQNLMESGIVSFFHDVFRFQYTENPGAFLSLGANIPEDLRHWIFTIFVGVFLAGILVYLLKSKDISNHQSIALSLLLGGGVSNLIDRIFNEGRVIDFMNLGIGPLRTGIFNVADSVILIGGIWLLIHSFKTVEKNKAV